MRRKWTRLFPIMIAVSVAFGTRVSVSAEQMMTQTAQRENASEVVLAESETLLLNEALSNAQESGLNVDYHTQQEIADYIKAHKSALSFSTTYKTEASAVSPYALGAISSETLNSAAEMLNIIRFVAGIPYNVVIDSTYSEKAQAAALVNAANGNLSHYPNRPDGMSDELYDLGCAGAGSSNIAAGYSSMVQAIKGWMSDEDSGNIDRVGHRRWCLNPTMGKVGFGEVYNPNSMYRKYYAMYAFDRSNASARSYSGVAWPAQNTPINLFASDDPWSISMGNSVSADSVVVTLKCVSNGKTYTFSSSQKNGAFYVNNSGYGQSGCIIFRPDDGTMCVSGTTYHVNIIGKYSSGATFNVDYNVNFFDISKPNSEESDLPDKEAIEIPVFRGAQNTAAGVVVSWNEVADAKLYALYLKKQDGTITLVNNRISDTSYTILGLAVGDKVGFVLKAYGNGNWSEWSSTLWTTPQLVVTEPQNLRTIAGNGEVTVSWDEVPGAQIYAVFLKKESGEVVLVHNRVYGTSYTITGLANGTTVGFVVKAYGNREWSGWSATVWATPSLPIVAPSNVLATAGNKTITVTWDAVPGAQVYALFLKRANGEVVLVDNRVSGTSYMLNDLVNGTSYGFVVKAYKARTWSGWSSTSWATPFGE